ncbi:MAG: ankyrin repeat domain-containing protein [Vicinamibacterales bacterium]
MRMSSTARAALVAGLVACSAGLLGAQAPTSPVADAAMAKEPETVQKLLRSGADPNAAQGDGMTALHWAALHGDTTMADMLLVAGANVRATTRIGGFTPLHLACRAGQDGAVVPMLKAGAPADAPTSTGATPLMLAAASGNAAIVNALADAGAALDATESANGQTALMFAAGLGRTEAVQALLAHGAKPDVQSHVVDLSTVEVPEEVLQDQLRQEQGRATAARAGSAPAAAAPNRAGAAPARVAGVDRPYKYNELIGQYGGLTALHLAARQGAADTVKALVEGGADVNRVTAGDHSSPMVIAAINGQFDLVAYLLSKGADPNLASDAGMTPLYAVLNVQWQPRSFYPQPRAYLQQKTSYLDLMTQLLDKGADPNARTNKKIWYTQYNFDLLRVDDQGATPFWRAAYASDIEAMKLLVARGADPSIPTAKPAANDRFRQGGVRSTDESRDHSGLPPVPTNGPDIPPLLAASGAGYGEGFAGNAHRFAPSGMLAAVKYLIEDLGTDPNVRDADGNTALHHAASRGDNEMIKYLVSKGADVTKVNRGGQTTVDMANGPVQRVQPFPETIKLLESLGATNNHKCVSC